jgi:hypothetical protein
MKITKRNNKKIKSKFINKNNKVKKIRKSKKNKKQFKKFRKQNGGNLDIDTIIWANYMRDNVLNLNDLFKEIFRDPSHYNIDETGLISISNIEGFMPKLKEIINTNDASVTVNLLGPKAQQTAVTDIVWRFMNLKNPSFLDIIRNLPAEKVKNLYIEQPYFDREDLDNLMEVLKNKKLQSLTLMNLTRESASYPLKIQNPSDFYAGSPKRDRFDAKGLIKFLDFSTTEKISIHGFIYRPIDVYIISLLELCRKSIPRKSIEIKSIQIKMSTSYYESHNNESAYRGIQESLKRGFQKNTAGLTDLFKTKTGEHVPEIATQVICYQLNPNLEITNSDILATMDINITGPLSSRMYSHTVVTKVLEDYRKKYNRSDIELNIDIMHQMVINSMMGLGRVLKEYYINSKSFTHHEQRKFEQMNEEQFYAELVREYRAAGLIPALPVF